jgi:hypothetical protein
MSITARSYRGGVTPAVTDSREREEEEISVKMNLTRGSHLSVVDEGREGNNGYRFGGGWNGPRAGLVRRLLGWSGFRVGPVAAFLSFFCSGSFLLFSISLLTFLFVTQMISNQFVKFSKIQLNILRQ